MLLSKNEIKRFASLSLKKNRIKESLFVAEGKRLTSELLKSSINVERIIVTEDFINKFPGFLAENNHHGYPVYQAGGNDFKRFTDTVNPQGIAVVAEIPPKPDPAQFGNGFIVALNGVSDPGNLGTILRTADWFGMNEIIMDAECAEIFNPKVVRSSMGAVFNLKIAENCDFSKLLPAFKTNQYNITTADLNGTPLKEFNFGGKHILVFANEANGPDDVVLAETDSVVTIPKLGNVESLNVASAAAVIISEASLR